jgi:hypothetical protein
VLEILPLATVASVMKINYKWLVFIIALFDI